MAMTQTTTAMAKTPSKTWQRIQKHLLIFAIMGMIGLNLEVAARWIDNDLVRERFNGASVASAVGWTSLWMLGIYGVGGVVLGWMNATWIGKRHMAFQVFTALAFMLTFEIAMGSVLNLWWELRVWDYGWQGVCVDGRHIPLHFQGQICLLAAGEFFLLSPLAFWIDDMIRWLVYHEPSPDARPAPLASYYRPILALTILVAILVVVLQIVVLVHRDCAASL